MKIVEDDYTRFGWLIFPWGGTADDDVEAERLERVNLADDAEVKALIERDLIPWFKDELGHRRADALEGLRYALNASADELERMFAGDLVAFSPNSEEAQRIVLLISKVFQEHQIHLPPNKPSPV